MFVSLYCYFPTLVRRNVPPQKSSSTFLMPSETANRPLCRGTCPPPALSPLAETKHDRRSVVNRQQYNGSECQMCPCYIIDDIRSALGFHQCLISKIFSILVALLIHYMCSLIDALLFLSVFPTLQEDSFFSLGP